MLNSMLHCQARQVRQMPVYEWITKSVTHEFWYPPPPFSLIVNPETYILQYIGSWFTKSIVDINLLRMHK